MDYATYYLEALKQIKEAHEALLKRDFVKAHDHCLNAQAEIRLMSVNVKSWIPEEEVLVLVKKPLKHGAR